MELSWRHRDQLKGHSNSVEKRWGRTKLKEWNILVRHWLVPRNLKSFMCFIQSWVPSIHKLIDLNLYNAKTTDLTSFFQQIGQFLWHNIEIIICSLIAIKSFRLGDKEQVFSLWKGFYDKVVTQNTFVLGEKKF